MTDDELLQQTLDAEEVPVYADGRRQLSLLVKEVKGLQETFNLVWKAERRGIKSWQDATGRELTWPDKANFTVWLLSRLEHADIVIQVARDLGKIHRKLQGPITDYEATALHLALHVVAYDKEYPTPLNDPNAECCRFSKDT